MWLSAPRLTQPDASGRGVERGEQQVPAGARRRARRAPRGPRSRCRGRRRPSRRARARSRGRGRRRSRRARPGSRRGRRRGGPSAPSVTVRQPRGGSGPGGGTSRCHNAHMGVPWPLFGLVLRSARLELRSPTDDDLLALLEVARAGIHDPASMPFAIAWTDLRGDAFDQGFLQFYWGTRASWTVEAWSLPLAVFLEGQPIGVQEISANELPDASNRRHRVVARAAVRRARASGPRCARRCSPSPSTTSGRSSARSGALEGNEASRRVSTKLGYRSDGLGEVAPRGTPVREDRFVLGSSGLRARALAGDRRGIRRLSCDVRARAVATRSAGPDPSQQ